MEESLNQTIIEAQVTEALRSCYDPEIPVNIYDMGLIYDIVVDASSGEPVSGVQVALADPATGYALGSTAGHVLLHQSIVGEEAIATAVCSHLRADDVVSRRPLLISASSLRTSGRGRRSGSPARRTRGTTRRP